MTTVFRLREVLEQRAEPLAVAELARLADVSRTTVHAMYHNLTTRVDLATLEKLAKALDVEPGELVGSDKRGKR